MSCNLQNFHVIIKLLNNNEHEQMEAGCFILSEGREKFEQNIFRLYFNHVLTFRKVKPHALGIIIFISFCMFPIFFFFFLQNLPLTCVSSFIFIKKSNNQKKYNFHSTMIFFVIYSIYSTAFFLHIQRQNIK